MTRSAQVGRGGAGPVLALREVSAATLEVATATMPPWHLPVCGKRGGGCGGGGGGDRGGGDPDRSSVHESDFDYLGGGGDRGGGDPDRSSVHESDFDYLGGDPPSDFDYSVSGVDGDSSSEGGDSERSLHEAMDSFLEMGGYDTSASELDTG
jgi:hypothetical protein